MTTRLDETRDDLAVVIDDWLRERVAGLPAPDRAMQAALVEIHATPQAERRSAGRWLDRMGGGKRPDDRGDAVGHSRTAWPVLGHARLDGAASVALSGPAKGIAAVAMVVALGTVFLVARPVGHEPGGAEAVLPPVTGPAGNGLIAIERDGDIYLGDPNTGESTELVAGPEMDTRPRFSPDGTRIAFFRLRAAADTEDGEDFENADLIVVGADGSDEQVMDLTVPDTTVPYGREPWDFVWSPDGGSLVVLQVVGPLPTMALSLVDADGVARARPLTSRGGPYGFGDDQVAWFLRPPSGDRLLVSAWLPDPILSVSDLDGSDVVDLGELAGLDEALRRWAAGKSYPRYQGVRENGAAWSPDASRIAFKASFNSHLHPDHFYVMDEDGSDLRLLSDEAGGFAWSPDGSTIATQRSDRIEPGSTDYCADEWYIDFCAAAEWITLIDVETGAERALEATRFPNPGVADPARDWPAIGDWSWSPDGRSILMMLGEPGTRPLVIDVASDTAAELPWQSDSMPSWQRVAAD